MARSREELAQQERFEAQYAASQASVMLAIERCVRGCDYGGNSWTNRAEAERISELLGLRPGVRYLELGAGSGWPGLHMSKISGCEVVLVDLPMVGLRMALERARKDGFGDRVRVAAADAAKLPFPDNSFDAIAHSDLLCCLKPKRVVLEACRRVVRANGRMVFTVILAAPGLSLADQKRALSAAPEFTRTDTEYPALLEQTGWIVTSHEDVTAGFGELSRLQLQADTTHASALTALIGEDAFGERMNRQSARVAAIDDGLLRREVFVAVARP